MTWVTGAGVNEKLGQQSNVRTRRNAGKKANDKRKTDVSITLPFAELQRSFHTGRSHRKQCIVVHLLWGVGKRPRKGWLQDIHQFAGVASGRAKTVHSHPRNAGWDARFRCRARKCQPGSDPPIQSGWLSPRFWSSPCGAVCGLRDVIDC